MRDVNLFERMLVDSGVELLKFWVHVSAEEQEKRFQERASDPRKRWKLSPIDLEARRRWAEFSKYRNKMLEETHTDYAPWRVIDGDDKERGRLNCIRSILDTIPYDYNEEAFRPVTLPPRQSAQEAGYQRSGVEKKLMVKNYYEKG
jgi:polyphosphate kinase 2 (PPK2 family)